MTESTKPEHAVDLLQQLGLKEYEARCFVALTQLPTGTAKEISELADIPRTRVYDAIRVLEAEGLVTVQHGSPRRFRAVSVSEAAETLRMQYLERIDTLQTTLNNLSTPTEKTDDELLQQVWTLSNRLAIESRTIELIDKAGDELILVVADETMLSGNLFDRLNAAKSRGVDVIVGGFSSEVIEELKQELASIEVFESGLDWLAGPQLADEAAVGRLLLTDRENLFVSSIQSDRDTSVKPTEEHAVFASGLGNGLVVIARRLISTERLQNSSD